MYEGEGGDVRSVLHSVIIWRKMPQESLAYGAARLPDPGLESCVAKFQQESASSPPMKLPISFFGQGSLLAEKRSCFFCRRKEKACVLPQFLLSTLPTGLWCTRERGGGSSSTSFCMYLRRTK